ncbi:DUF3667 domain-containing protein [Flavobacterium sp. ZB4P13]|uniref:DUF3667 domain-containing protein n=1 Tax=Flavobacterium sp. ZB4P13 TaxID=3401728 RepID=UPI003AAF0A0E
MQLSETIIELEDLELKPKLSEKLKRIDGHYISHEIQHLLHFEKGFLFTIKSLLIRPGKAIREFIFEDREKYIKPVLFLIFTSVIFTFILHSVHITISFFNVDKFQLLKGELRSKEIGEWTDNHVGYAQLIMGVFIAFWIKFFYRKFKYSIYEILVLLSFVMGEAILIFTFFIVFAKVFKSQNLVFIGSVIYFVYIIWAIGQFFGEKKISNYIKSILAYFLGSLTYMSALVLITYLLKFL